ncbi:MAG TPA: hypothetical protein VNE86_01310 [Nitrososphaerales archaeon]|nr:hypothetical protein [Nitrososphaerales archaeon]
MMGPKVLPLVIATMAILSFALVMPVASGQSSGPQYVVYSINAIGPNHTLSATVNETVLPNSNNGLSSVTLQVISNYANLSYSKLVNASQKILPILPSIGTRSIDITIKNATVSASVTQTGTQSISFSGANYPITNYSFNLSVQKAQKSVSASGQLAVFASGLVYSATININGTRTVSVQLLSTNLPLGASSSSSNGTTTTIAVAGGSVSILAGVGAFAFFKYGKKNPAGSSSEAKPLHWVD